MQLAAATLEHRRATRRRRRPGRPADRARTRARSCPVHRRGRGRQSPRPRPSRGSRSEPPRPFPARSSPLAIRPEPGASSARRSPGRSGSASGPGSRRSTRAAVEQVDVSGLVRPALGRGSGSEQPRPRQAGRGRSGAPNGAPVGRADRPVARELGQAGDLALALEASRGDRPERRDQALDPIADLKREVGVEGPASARLSSAVISRPPRRSGALSLIAAWSSCSLPRARRDRPPRPARARCRALWTGAISSQLVHLGLEVRSIAVGSPISQTWL